MSALKHIYWAIRYGRWDWCWYSEWDWAIVCEYYDGNIFGVRAGRVGLSVIY